MLQNCDREYIKTILPHRDPMLLIDECTINDDGTVLGKYRIKDDEFFIKGHFPGNPIVPGVIQCEIMAQTCAMLVKDELKGHIALYAGLDNVRFKHLVRPGDLCEIKAVLNGSRGSGSSRIFFCSAKLTVEGKLCCKADMTFAMLQSETNEGSGKEAVQAE